MNGCGFATGMTQSQARGRPRVAKTAPDLVSCLHTFAVGVALPVSALPQEFLRLVVPPLRFTEGNKEKEIGSWTTSRRRIFRTLS
jgi:hypothetical protein